MLQRTLTIILLTMKCKVKQTVLQHFLALNLAGRLCQGFGVMFEKKSISKVELVDRKEFRVTIYFTESILMSHVKAHEAQ